jgi:hypothetical protein
MLHIEITLKSFSAKANGFVSKESVKNEIFTHTPESLAHPSVMKKLTLHGHILCNINLNCTEFMQ